MANHGIYLIYTTVALFGLSALKELWNVKLIRYERYLFRLWDSFLGLQFYKILSRFLCRAGEIMFRMLNITRY